jgi:hypothetical protein
MDKNLSHQDTKVKTKGTKKTSFVPSSTALRLCMKPLLASLLVLLSLPVLAQKNSARFDPDGAFWILGDTPNDFSEFGAINLNAKRSRRLPVQGFELRNGKRLAFKTLTVKRDNFTFTTAAAGGISYAFSGKFLKGGVYSAGDLDDTIAVLEGTLTKFRGGQKVAEAKLKFSYFGGT